MRRQQADKTQRACRQCGRKFFSRRSNQTFCSRQCRMDHHNDTKYRAIKHYNSCPLIGAKIKPQGMPKP